MAFHWIDGVIVAIVVYYAVSGWREGLLYLLSSFGAFLASFWLAIRYGEWFGTFLVEKLAIPSAWAGIAGYIIVAFVSEMFIAEILMLGVAKLPKKLLDSKTNQFLGAIVSIVNALVLIAFFLLLIMKFPLRGTIKQDVKDSLIGKWLVVAAEKYGGQASTAFDELSKRAVKFVTIDPGSKETMGLDVRVNSSDLSADADAEAEMLVMVNAERAKAGLPALVVDATIVPVARAHSTDMFIRSYFSHYTPEGLSPGDRLEKGGVMFTKAGENLAYSPDVASAHVGLMNSEGHRKNIMDPEYHRVGIGIISTSNYGIMVTQNFAN